MRAERELLGIGAKVQAKSILWCMIGEGAAPETSSGSKEYCVHLEHVEAFDVSTKKHNL